MPPVPSKWHQKLVLTALSSVFAVAQKASPRVAAHMTLPLLFKPKRHKRPERETHFWSTGAPVTFPSGRKARSWGVGSGPWVWLVHGWEGRGSQLMDFVPGFLERGFRVLAWEAPAHGDNVGNSASLVAFARALREDIDSWSEPVWHFVGHSLGATSTLVAHASGMPARSIVTLAPPSQLKMMFADLEILLGIKPPAMEALFGILEKKFNTSTADLEPEALAQRITAPVLILHGGRDRDVPASSSEGLEKLLPHGQRILIGDVGHVGILRHAKAIDESIQFTMAYAEDALRKRA